MSRCDTLIGSGWKLFPLPRLIGSSCHLASPRTASSGTAFLHPARGPHLGPVAQSTDERALTACHQPLPPLAEWRSSHMGRKLYVGNLPYDVGEADLQQLF